jgi:hypothetical protein
VKKSLVAFVILAVFSSCTTPKQTTEAKPETTTTVDTKTEVAAAHPTQDSLVAYLERTACYGQCPMYKFSIYNSGYAVYEGKRFVEKLGKYEAHLNASVLEELKTKAKAINYFGFKDEYPKTASDFPATKTAIVLDGKRKDIMNGTGAPSALKEFEKYLDSVKDGAEWRQVH